MIKKIMRSGYRKLSIRVPEAKKGPFFKSVMVHPSENLVFVRVPKAGCSTVIARLINQHGKQNDSTLKLHAGNDLITFDHAGFSKRLFGLPVNQTKTFSVVRNPYTRLLSAFREKIDLNMDGPRYREEFGITQGEDISFADFVDILIKRNPLSLDMHFMPQSIITAKETVLYDKIFHLERMQECLDWLNMIFPDESLSEYESIAPHATNANNIAKSIYTRETQEKVACYYKKDFEMLGYHKDIEMLDHFERVDSENLTPITQIPMGTFTSLDCLLRSKIPTLLNRH